MSPSCAIDPNHVGILGALRTLAKQFVIQRLTRYDPPASPCSPLQQNQSRVLKVLPLLLTGHVDLEVRSAANHPLRAISSL